MQTAGRKYRRSNQVFSLVRRTPFGESLVIGIILCLLPTYFLHAQIITPSSSGIILPEPVFNKAFIKNNKIKSVRANVVDKPDGEIIRDKGLAENFLFDTSGNLVRHYYNEITSLAKTEIEIPAVY